MKCTPITIEHEGRKIHAIVCGSRKQPKRCGCGVPSKYLCDHALPGGKTCDAPLCDSCTTRTAAKPLKDYCRRHKPPQQELALA